VTDVAVAAICVLTTQDDVPEGSGLRISAGVNGSLRLTIAPGPHDGDVVIEVSGARMFLDSAAAQTLEGQTLDAEADDAGGIRFAVL